MRRKKKNDNSKKILLITIIVVIILFLSIFLILLKQKKQPDLQDQTNDDYNQVVNDVKEYYINDELEIIPDGYNFWARTYEGQGDDGQLYPMLYMTAFRQVIDGYKELGTNPSTSRIQEYYKKNKNEIQEDTGIDNEQDYIKLAQTIYTTDPGEYKNAAFDLSYYENNEEYTTIGINFEYTNTTINLKAQIANYKERGNTKIKILAR